MTLLATTRYKKFLFTESGSTESADAQSLPIEKIWNKYFPSDPFNYFFLDDFFGQQYKADQLFGKVFGMFASLASSLHVLVFWVYLLIMYCNAQKKSVSEKCWVLPYKTCYFFYQKISCTDHRFHL